MKSVREITHFPALDGRHKSIVRMRTFPYLLNPVDALSESKGVTYSWKRITKFIERRTKESSHSLNEPLLFLPSSLDRASRMFAQEMQTADTSDTST